MLDHLRNVLSASSFADANWCVALSGGVDSAALLHALASLRDEFPDLRLRAAHVDHQLQADSDQWAIRVTEFARALGIEVVVHTVTVDPDNGNGLEAAARTARYAALQADLEQDEVLATAHHLDDQVETLLLRLLRGSGPHGLASIRTFQRFAPGWLARPLLGIDRSLIESYATDAGLTWIEDPANLDQAQDRNFLRHEILPRLRDRWPGLTHTLGRSARLNAEAADLLDTLAASDVASLGDEHRLSLHGVIALPDAERRNLIRYWLRSAGLQPPGEARLKSELQSLLAADDDKAPVLHAGGGQIRRYRDQLHLLRFDPEQALSRLPSAYDWNPGKVIRFGSIRGSLSASSGSRFSAAGELQVRFRAGGERILLRGQHKSVKKLFQADGIVPWMRGHIPLVYRADSLIAVGDLWRADEVVEPKFAWENHAQLR